MGVEGYLQSIGFKGPYLRENGEDYLADPKQIGNFSTMGSLANKWKHPDGRVMVYGLMEANHAPTICNPRPVHKRIDHGGGLIELLSFDAHDIDRHIAENGVAATVARCFEDKGTAF